MSGIDATAYVMRLKMKTPAHKLALLAVAARCDQQYSCYPSRALVAGEALVSEERAKTILRDLRRDGYLTARNRYRENGSNTSNRFFVHGPWDRWDATGTPFPEIDYYADQDDRYAAIREGEFIPRPEDEKSDSGGGVASNPPSGEAPEGWEGVISNPPGGLPVVPRGGNTDNPPITDHYEPARENPSRPSGGEPFPTNDHQTCCSAEGVRSVACAHTREDLPNSPADVDGGEGDRDALRAEKLTPRLPLSQKIALRVPRSAELLASLVGELSAYQRDRLDRLVNGLLVDGDDDAMIAARLRERLKPLATGDPSQPYRFRRDGLSWVLSIGLPCTPGGMTQVPCRNSWCGQLVLGKATDNVRCDDCELAAQAAKLSQDEGDSGAVPPPMEELLRQLAGNGDEPEVPGARCGEPDQAPAPLEEPDVLPSVVREQLAVIAAADPAAGHAAERAATAMYTEPAEEETAEQQRRRTSGASAAFHTITSRFSAELASYYAGSAV